MNADEVRSANLAMAVLCGYPVERAYGLPNRPDPYILDDEHGVFVERPDADDYRSEQWSPCTNPAQALEVAEALRRKGLYVRLTLIPDSENRDQHYIAKVEKKDGPSRLPLWDVYRLGYTVAEAICLAAAETLESEAGT